MKTLTRQSLAWSPIVVVLTIVLLLVGVAAVLSQPLALWYYASVAPSGIEKAWGFKLANADGALVIVGVTPGGPFAAAGVQSGDRPDSFYQYHGVQQIYRMLACARDSGFELVVSRGTAHGERVEFSVKPPPKRGALCFP